MSERRRELEFTWRWGHAPDKTVTFEKLLDGGMFVDIWEEDEGSHIVKLSPNEIQQLREFLNDAE